jgi:uncharacterized protein (DUF1330 family)
MEGTMPAYVIATTKGVNDRRGLEEYWSRAGVTFEGTGAKRLAIYTPFKLLEGKGPIEGVTLIEFPDMESASRWYESAAYQAVKQYRVGAADIELILVDGGAVAAEDRMPNTKGNVQGS